ncbi:MAG: putative nucleotide-diphospho-sugar transferase, partial [bacterium]
MTYLNSGCKSICDNMLYSANSVGISKDQFLIVAFDRAIFDYYSQQGYEVELFEDVPEETYHNWTWDPNSKFRALVKHKWTLLKKYFSTNKSLMWLDSDVVFLKNPEEILKTITLPT